MSEPVRMDDLEALKRAVKLKRLQEKNKEKRVAVQNVIQPADRSKPLALSWAQQRLWFLDQLDAAAGSAYNMPSGLRLRGRLDTAALRATLDRITARHENLRTTFVTENGQPAQRIGAADTGFSLTEQDLSTLPPSEREAAVQAISRDIFTAHFKLADGPLIQGRLLKLDDTEHLLLINQHHIITDGWSSGVLLKEVATLYTAFSQGQPDPLPPLPIQYADYASWQRGWLQGEVLSAQTGYWKQHLAGAPDLLALPADRPRPAAQSYAGASVAGMLPAALSQGLRQLGQRHGATLFMTALAGWAALVSRMSGQSSVVVGTPIANRQRTESEGLIGFFVNTLALHLDTGTDPSVAEFLAQVKTHTLNAYTYQDLPFEQVVEALAPARSLSYSPLFQTMLSMNDMPQGGPLKLPGLELEQVELEGSTTHFDLQATVTDTPDGLVVQLSYATDLFDEATVRQYLARYERVLAAMVADDATRIGALPLLSADERTLLLDTFNDSARAFPREQLIHQAFEARATLHPDAPAILCEGRSLSYGELNRRANQVAHTLIARGVQREQRVALCVERSVEMAVGLMGILKAGAAYVPMEPHQPAERLAHMLADSAAVAVLTHSSLAGMLPATAGTVLALDGDAFAAAPGHDPDPVQLGLDARKLAYVIYTSGSTGASKGVMVEHHSALNFWKTMQRTTHRSMPAHARIALNASFAFDMSWKGWLQLLSGHCVHLIPQSLRVDGKQVLAFLEEHRIDAFDSTPSQLELLIGAGLLENPRYHPVSVLLGGEAIQGATWSRLQQARHIEFYNMYGPTECTVDATLEQILPDAARPHIGRPLDNARIYILDERLQPVPVGVAGEIHIGGACVARGYLDRPDLTAERFIADPFAGQGGARMYKTGDLGRWLADGRVEYLGRNDFQVKIRGFRVELGEIEAALRSHAAVREALVMARKDDGQPERLVAYFVARDGAETDLAALRKHMAASLPEHMVPAAFVALGQFPLNANGKTDRRALPAPDAGAVVQTEYAAPEGEAEQALGAIWQELLGVPQVGRYDQFFALGGHSLLLIDMMEQLRKRGLKLEMRHVFANLPLAELAAAATALEGESAPAVPANLIEAGCRNITPEMLPLVQLSQDDIDAVCAQVSGGAANVQDIYPLMPFQEGILFHYLLDTEGDPYLSRSVIAFDSRSRLDVFLDALQRVIARHDIFRSAVFWDGLPQPVQVVLREAPIPVTFLAPPAGEGSEALDILMARTDPRHLRLDVRQAPLLAAYVIADAATGEYLLAIMNQHMVSDHVALDTIMGEIRLLLEGRAELLPAPVPFRNYIAQSRAVGAAEHKAYFTAELADIAEPTAPFGLMDTQRSGGQVQETRVELEGALPERIRAAARRHGVSPAVLFHVAWGQVLALCTGHDDVVFGTVLAGRMGGAEGVGQAVGLFLNTLPIRIGVGEGSVQQVLERSAQRLSELLRHEQASLALAQQCSGVAAGLPLFSSLLNYRHSAAAPAWSEESAWTGMRRLSAEERTNYPFAAAVDDRGQGFGLTIQTVGVDSARIVHYLQSAADALATALLQQPGAPMRSLDILPAAERRQVLEAFNAGVHHDGEPALVHAQFEAQASLHPDALAVTGAGGSFTYAELNARANRIARSLRALGVGADDRVALCAERGAGMIAGLLAIFKAGAGYVPLDPAYPAERLDYMLADSKPAAIVTETALAARFDGAAPAVLVDDAAHEAQDGANLAPLAGGASLAYVIYTSGSTGLPKGVMVEHRSLANLAHSQVAAFGVGPSSRVLQFVSMSFDVFISEVAMTLCSGATLVMAPADALLPGDTLEATLREHAISHVSLPMAVLAAMPFTDRLESLQALIVGGETLPPALAAQWARRYQVFNCYGPTETTVCATFHACKADGEGAVPIGRPVANTRIYVLDAAMRPAPAGVAGEIYIGGTGVARGYHERAQLTAERFVADPFSNLPGARLYKTGDLGCWLPDGSLDYLGRNDFQVKLRGFRIEPGEIEARLLACEGVREALVLVREDQPGEKRLVAYLTGEPAPAAQLRAALAQHLAEHMLPSAFVALERFPLTPNGKIDRRALPAPDQAAVAARSFEAPQGETELAVAAIWQELLGVPQVGRGDHFFELGGHSLLAVQLMSRLRRALGVEAALRDLFAHPLLADFAARIGACAGTAAQPIPAAPRTGSLPLSWAQQRLWFLHQLDAAASAAYHLPAGLRLSGRLDIVALKATLDRIVARHENLRTTFATADARPVMRIGAPGAGFALSQDDISELSGHEQECALERISVDQAAAPFDLAAGPLIHGRLVRLGEDEHVLLINQHHIISDGWSIGLLVREVSTLYAAFCRGEGDPLPPLAIQYADYAVWQRDWLQGDALQAQLGYWKRRLDGAPALLALPSDRPRPAVQSYAGERVAVAFPAALSDALRDLGARHGATMFMTLLAGWGLLMSRMSGQDDVVVGTPVANRQRAELEHLIGFFVNTLALRVSSEGNPSVAAMLRQVRADTLDAYAHQDLPFEQVVEALKPVRSMSHSPLFQTLLALNNTPAGGELTLPGLSLSGLQRPHATTHFDISVSLVETPEGLRGNLEYASDLFDASTVERIAGYFESLLWAMAAGDSAPVASLPLLGAAESERLVRAWNDSAVQFPERGLLHQMFEAHAARAGDSPAIIAPDERLSYAELNARANQVAHHLIARGIGADNLVAICARRGAGMVAAVLGVLKAGAAWLPLDPDYPAQRLAFMLEDSAPAAVLAEPGLLEGVSATSLAAMAGQPTHNPAVQLSGEHLAYVIYTSGSTGLPKGVMNRHAGLANLAQAQAGLFGVHAGSRVLQFASFSFDASVWEFAMALANGASLVMAAREDLLPGALLAATLRVHGVTHATLPASAAALTASGDLPALACLVLAGEACPPAVAARWAETVRVFNAYGPTETTVCATVHACRAGASGAVPIGRPIANTQVYILDAALQPAPAGVCGEIYIGGAGVARGYLNRQELTAERFVPDPFNPGARLYRTGDLGRWLADGSIDYIGRNDFQVKLRGFRIELGEIEARLCAFEGVREALVVAQGERLVAYLAAPAQTDIAAVRRHVAGALAEYMVPGAYVVLEQFPLTSNGKVDRQALPVPGAGAAALGDYEAPQGAAEEAMAAIWQELLGLPKVGRNDQFFALGGHSLMVIDLIEALRKRSLALEMRHVFSALSLAELAAAVTPLAGASQEEVPPSLIAPGCTRITPDMLPLAQMEQADIDAVVAQCEGGAANVQDIYPLVPLQEGILFHYLLDTEGDPYLSRSVLAFDGRERMDGFLAALQAVIARHDILRSAVFWDGLDQPVQVVLREARLPVTELALDADGDALEQMLAATDPRHLRLDLRRAPLLAAYAGRDAASGDYLLAILNQHMVSDHVALDTIMAEIGLILQGQGAKLPVPVPFRQFIAQGRAVSKEGHQAYFRAQLAGVTEPTAPFGLLDTQKSGGQVDETRLELGAALAARVRLGARRHGVSPAVLFHVAWGQVLSLCTGRDEVVFGTVLAGRMRGTEGVGQAVGLFLNTLPIRIGFGAAAMDAVVAGAAERLAELLQHEQASLALAQQCSGVAAGLPLFSSLLNYRHSGGGSGAGGANDWTGIRRLALEERTNYPFVASVDDNGSGFSLSVQTVGVASARIAGYLEQAVTALTGALLDEPARAAGTLDLLPADEREQVLRGFNAERRDYPRGKLVHQLFEEQAARNGGAPAVVAGGRSVSYAELNERANILAHRLIGLGVGPDARVAICAERSIEMVIGLLAILKAGGAYVPMDPDYPSERLAYMLDDCEPMALLTQTFLQERLPAGLPVLCLDAPHGGPAHNPSVPLLRDDSLAYVIYTSGSTGQPKGAMNQHDGVVNRLLWAQDEYRLGAADRVLQKTPFGFDVSVWEFFLPLLAGATLVMAPPQAHQNPHELAALVDSAGITTMHFVPPMLDVFLQSLAAGQCASLRQVLCSGEALPYALQQRFLAALPHVALHNLYGPTEAAIDVTAWPCSAGTQAHPGIVPIGRPIANIQMYVLDAHLRPAPLGVAGELYIGGIGVGRGYLKRDALTSERFIADPFSGAPGARLYRTGDLGRWLDDGSIEYLGRNDFQVKIRGFRIELGEIEARLAQCSGVREALVLARDEQGGGKRLVAYLTGEPAPAAQLRTELSAHLAEFMLPSAFVTLESFPLTPNGKIDRKALPAPDSEALALRAYTAPQGGAELALAGVWQELLGVERVGRDDHFFELGGHSLLAVQLMSRLRKGMGVEIGLRELFAHPTLSSFAQRLARAQSATLDAIVPADRAGRLPLSWAQQRLWFLDQLDARAGAAYHMPAGLKLSGELDVAALQATLDRIVARHESLRTTFVLDGPDAIQRIAPADAGFALERHDLSALAGAAQQEMVETRRAAFYAAPFKLAEGPLIRGMLLRVSAREHLLLINQHHIVTDGWSTGVLVQEVSALYAAFCQGLPDPLPPLAIQYADYAAWQRGWLQGEALTAQLGYWKDQLSGAPDLLALPTDGPRPAVQSYAGRTAPFQLPAQLGRDLKALGARHGATLFMTLLTGWGILMARLSGQDDVVVGTPVANRHRSEVENLIGYFLNTLALRVTLAPGTDVAGALAGTRDMVLAAYGQQDVPFEQVLEACSPVRSLSHNALFQTMFAFNNTPAGGDLALPGLTLSALAQTHASTYCDLYLSLRETPDGIGGALIYATDLFGEATIARFLGYFEAVLQGMVEDDRAQVHRLRLLDEAERHLQLVTWNQSAQDYPLEKDFARLFAEQVALHPARIAASCEGESLTYAELDARAARVAKALLDAGAGRDVLVTLVSERNLVLLTMMVAVFKAGAAFLPLDVKHPAARLRDIVSMSGSPLVLCSASCSGQVAALAGELPVLVVEDHWTAGPVPELVPLAQPDDLAYVIFTSGSTGKPKGAMVEQRGMLNHMFGKISTMAIDASDSMAQTASPAFDICVWQFLSALLVGGRTVVVPDQVAYDPSRLLHAVQEQGITLLQTVPSMMRSLLDGSGEGLTLAALRYMIPTGEALTTRLSQDWFDRFPQIPLMNVYGPAECSDDVTWHPIAQRPEDGSVTPIGRPTPNNRIYILDRHLQMVPVGVKGEICVDGAGVGRGYLNNPEQTAAAFVPHPLGGEGRFYRTGDLGSYRADGTIDFHGRLDFQVKIRGFRIELGEIESRLSQCEGVKDAVVLVTEHQGDKRLVAYLTGGPAGAAQLRLELAEHLADYMIPSAFVALERFPLTPNGKLDRKALPAPDMASMALREYAAPEGEVEETLAAVWRDVLGLERVGRKDHFFELGGSSLLATQVFVRLRTAFEVELQLIQLFQNPVLSDLAEAIVLEVLKQFDSGDIDMASAGLDGLSDAEIDALLEQERKLSLT